MRKVKDLRKWLNFYDEIDRLTEEVSLAVDYYKEEIITEAEVDAAYEFAQNSPDPQLSVAFEDVWVD